VTTILIHNGAYRNEEEARSAMPTEADVRAERWWNIWRTRQAPFSAIENGSFVLLLDSWPGRGGVLSWLVRAEDVRKQVLPDKNAAVQSIASWVGETRRWVLGNPYTADRRADAGVVIFWRAEPIIRLDVVRPPQLTIRRNGWLVTDDAQLRSWGVALPAVLGLSTGPTRRASQRQGRRQLDVEVKLKIERRAMAAAKAWCRRRGWSAVVDVSRSSSWDLEATDQRGAKRYIEVKGTTGGGEAVEVTGPQVADATKHGAAHTIVIVHGIDVRPIGDEVVATGGTVVAYDPWAPKKSELVAEKLTWRPATTRVTFD